LCDSSSTSGHLTMSIVTPTLRELHWLPLAARVQYKLCLHSAVVCTAPNCVRDMLHPASERMSQSALRSATNNEMLVPRSRLKSSKRAFSIAAPRAWNSLPADLRATVNTGTFKKKLKTFLFYFIQLNFIQFPIELLLYCNWAGRPLLQAPAVCRYHYQRHQHH